MNFLPTYLQVKHLDIELDSPELNKKDYLTNEMVDNYLKRANSATKDPGVVGPIVWDLRRKRVVEGVQASFYCILKTFFRA